MTIHKNVKIAVVGVGAMGSGHIKNLRQLQTAGKVEIVGVCDVIKDRADKFAEELQIPAYDSHTELLNKPGLEAITVATPHYDHPSVAIDAFNRGIHVLCEKPIAVHLNDAEKMIAAYERAKEAYPELVFAIMFQERTYPFHKKLKEIVQSGKLGKLIRVTWINTQWFRPQFYYDSGDWRATWAGEGGGILTNQCPHNMDLYQWLFGMPAKISGFVNIGKYHNIEVEDEVTAYFEHENGMIGHFIATTAETPGTNRFEIVGEHGKLVYENEKIVMYQNQISVFDFILESKSKFGNVESWYTEIPVDITQPKGHLVVIEKFINAIQNGDGELVAHGTEGINGLTLANAIMQSSFTESKIVLPLDVKVC
ncbi:Gfo/Idh/MocA family protein [Paenibacillus sp. 32352]|uniref:Gfo/Idh/MocA family protein n=1 Tax=Paenibacillus sp. 32352 TaxID=1969111 RepID=UPI0009ADC4D2|nr:Gfo/Idh/MocA family oxidoreductase [Paenibacillus sp. 32352]